MKKFIFFLKNSYTENTENSINILFLLFLYIYKLILHFLQGTVADLARKTINAEVPGLPWLSGHHLTINTTRRTKANSVAVTSLSRPPKAFDDRSYLYLFLRVVGLF
jgi:hypothetical protein